jgi:hypothetical protein
MRRRGGALVLASSLGVAGCGETLVLCDSSEDVRWAIARGLGGRVNVSPFMLDHGTLRISIDGQCNFSLYDDSLRGLRRGVISANRASVLARDLHLGSYARLAEYDPPVCQDSVSEWVADGSAVLHLNNCLSHEAGAPGDLLSLARRIEPLARELDAISERVWRPVQVQILTVQESELIVRPTHPIYDWNAPLDLAANALSYADYADTDLPATGIPVEDDATLARLDELRALGIEAADDAGACACIERGLFVRDAEGRILQVLVRDEPSEAARQGWDVLLTD